jgi:hypothetical protein
LETATVKKPNTNKILFNQKMNMIKFECKDLSISDIEFGCTITFSEKVETSDPTKELTVEEIIASSGQYIMLQRTYGEDEFEDDYYYFEPSDFDKSCKLEDFKIELSRTQFAITINKEIFETQITVEELEFENLKLVLTKIINGKGNLIISD